MDIHQEGELIKKATMETQMSGSRLYNNLPELASD